MPPQLLESLTLQGFDLSSGDVSEASALLSFDLRGFLSSTVGQSETAQASLLLLTLDFSSIREGTSETAAVELQFSFDLQGFGLPSSVDGASETTGTQLSLGLQGFDFSSATMPGVSSAEKQGKHVVPVSLAQDLADGPTVEGGPGVLDGGTLPNIFAIIAR